MFEDLIIDKSLKKMIKEWNKGNRQCPLCYSINYVPGLLLIRLDDRATQKFTCEICETRWEVLFSEDMSIIKITIL